MSQIKLIDGVEFRQVEGFPEYFVSASGIVLSYYHCYGKPVPHRIGRHKRKGYPTCTLKRNKKTYHRYVHRLVLETFVGPRLKDMETRHLDGNKTNNRLSNLVWGTCKQNVADTYRHGRKSKGNRVVVLFDGFGVQTHLAGQVLRGGIYRPCK